MQIFHFLLIIALIIISMNKEEFINHYGIQPIPMKSTQTGEIVTFHSIQVIFIGASNSRILEIISLADHWLNVRDVSVSTYNVVLPMELSIDAYKEEEEYEININLDKITISASSSTGLLWGIQSIRQVFDSYSSEQNFTVPVGNIIDKPRYLKLFQLN